MPGGIMPGGIMPIGGGICLMQAAAAAAADGHILQSVCSVSSVKKEKERSWRRAEQATRRAR